MGPLASGRNLHPAGAPLAAFQRSNLENARGKINAFFQERVSGE
jgi:hypothetical protein